MSVLLAVDTSTTYGGVALYDGTSVLAEETWHLQRGHDAALFAAVERMLALTGTTVRDISRVAVAIGPGSFTGVRVAIATAQGLARGSGARTAAVGTLDVVAHPWSGAGLRVCAVLPAGRRDEICCALYRRVAGSWRATSGVMVGTAVDLSRSLRGGAHFAGEVDGASRATFERELGTRATFATGSSTARRAGHLAEIGWNRLEAGESVPSEALQPYYLRPPMITERASGSAGRSA